MSGSYSDQVVRLTPDEVRQLADRLARAARPPAPPGPRWWQVALTLVVAPAGIIAILAAGVLASELLLS